MQIFGWKILEKFSNLSLEKTPVDTYCCEPLNDLFFKTVTKTFHSFTSEQFVLVDRAKLNKLIVFDATILSNVNCSSPLFIF